ncbi:MAG: terpene cyclase/mutase family protein [Kiritimatiellaeota bacterium]|nr:terpene cyclase/mutase family protein [Kiritimatiellota bacterium]
MKNNCPEVGEKSSLRGWDAVLEHSRGPAVSVSVHALLIVFLSTLIVREEPKRYDDIVSRVIEVDVSRPIEIPPPPPSLDDATRDEPDFDDTSVVAVVDPMESYDAAADFEDFESPESPDVPPIAVSNSPKILRVPVPSAFSGRSGAARERTGKSHATQWNSTQRALRKGLDWLAEHQNDDGSWGDTAKGNMPAYTGLALLAFLGHGEEPSSERYGSTVLKALKRLLAYLGVKGKGVRGGYRHAIVLYAVSEAYALSRIPMLQDAMDKGMSKLIAGENSRGSFNYGYDNRFDPKLGGPRCDLSVAGWNYQAMKAAFAAGYSSDGFEAAFDRAVNIGLRKTHFAKTGFRYGAKGGPSPSMTAVGTLCLQLMGEGKSKEVEAGLRYLQRPSAANFTWKPRKDGTVKPWSLYQWYYQTQVFFQAYRGKGGKWRKFDKMFTKALLRNQKRDGRWESPGFEFGYGKKGGEASLKGIDQPVYSTALCCLMLEVYYRYLTTFKVAEIAKNDASFSDGDIGLRLE